MNRDTPTSSHIINFESRSSPMPFPERNTDPRMVTDPSTPTLRLGSPCTEYNAQPYSFSQAGPARQHESQRSIRPPTPPSALGPRQTRSDGASVASANSQRREEEMENVFANVAATFTRALEKMTHRNTANKPLHWFSGLDHEDPVVFIGRMDRYFRQIHLEDDYEKLLITAEQLRGDARKWFEPHRNYMDSYETFVIRLQKRFDSPENIADKITKLYGDKQKTDETAEIFITKKRCLFQRIDPEKNEHIKAATILKQLLPEIRSRMRGARIRSIEELLQVAMEIEDDLQEERHHDWRARSRNLSAGNGNWRARTNSTPAAERRPPGVGPQTGVTPTRRETAERNEALPPSPCRHCGEWHFHRDCPRKQHQRQGNDWRTGENQRRPQQTVRRGQPINAIHQENEDSVPAPESASDQ